MDSQYQAVEAKDCTLTEGISQIILSDIKTLQRASSHNEML